MNDKTQSELASDAPHGLTRRINALKKRPLYLHRNLIHASPVWRGRNAVTFTGDTG